jgi:hypothetical protein
MPPIDPLNSTHPGFTPVEHTTFSMVHKHSGVQGDGSRIPASSLDTGIPFRTGAEPVYLPVNAPTSGRKYRIQVIEVLNENDVLTPVLQIVPA